MSFGGMSQSALPTFYQNLKSEILLGPIHVVTFTLISILATYLIQKGRGQALLFFFDSNLSPNLISK
jgi:hypothetical protein